jgi:subtilisin family serine protease
VLRFPAVAALALTWSVVPLPQTTGAAACRPPANAAIVTTTVPDTPWPLKRLGPQRVWPLTKGAGVTVAVIDSGVSAVNPALATRVISGYDLVDASGNGTCDENGHGTMIGGIIAATPRDGSKFYGLAPEARILPVRVTSQADEMSGAELAAKAAAAIRYVITQPGVKVINLSLQVSEMDPGLHAAIVEAVDRHDIVVVAAAGNVTQNTPAGAKVWPAADDRVIAVAALDTRDLPLASSLTGSHVSLGAPGWYVEGPMAGGSGMGLAADGGTSYAAAYVSGTVALIRSYRPDLSAEDIRVLLRETADQPGQVVNPYRAVVKLAGPGVLGVKHERSLSADQLKAIWISVAGLALLGLIFVIRLMTRPASD